MRYAYPLLPLREPGDRELWRSCLRGARTEFVRSLGNRSASGQYEWRQLATARIGGTGVIANAVLSIVSSIIGGGLVLAGQFFVKRAEDKRVWLIRLQEAASDLATSYLQEAA